MSETLPTHEEMEVSAGSSQQPSGQKKKREGPILSDSHPSFALQLITAARPVAATRQAGTVVQISSSQSIAQTANLMHRRGSAGSASTDIFDSSLNLETTHYNEGYADGYRDGLVTGKKDGYEVGLKHGFELGEELGFYRGLVDVWTSAIRVDPLCFSTRVQRSIQRMDELLSKYPIMEPENEGVDEIKESLRLKFRAICASLKVQLEYDGYPKAAGDHDIEF